MRGRYAEYKTISSQAKEELFRNGAISLDTNILLALYRQSSNGAEQMLAILERIKDRLWISDHVIYEFMKNRPSVMYENGSSGEEVQGLVSDFQAKFTPKLNEYLNRIVVDPHEREERKHSISLRLSDLIDSIGSIETAPDRDVDNDELLLRIEEILDSRVSEAATDEELRQWEQEFSDRAKHLIPPGYKDVNKVENAAGDLIIWKQLLRDLESGHFPDGILVVTADVKEDMYWRVKGRTLGPRAELRAEFAAHAPDGEPYWQISLGEFLVLASQLLSVEVNDVNTNMSASTGISRVLECGTWDPDSYNSLIEQLEEGGYSNQVEVIQRAAKNGGFISREEIYEVCDFDKPRLLNGFSQPVNRIHKELLSAESSKDSQPEIPMYARYSRPGKTIGYEVPLDFSFFILKNYSGWIEWAEDDPETLNDPDFLELVQN